MAENHEMRLDYAGNAECEKDFGTPERPHECV